MKQPEDKKTLDLALEQPKRGRGRPTKPDALTQAERAKRYRDAKRIEKTTTAATPKNAPWPDWGGEHKHRIATLETQLQLAEAERNAAMSEIDKLQRDLHNAEQASRINNDWGEEEANRNIALTRKFDLEHLAHVEALNKIATLEAKLKQPARNPLADEVHKLKAALRKRDKEHKEIMHAMQEELNRASRK